MSKCCPKIWIKFFKAVCDNNRQAILDYLHDNKKVKAGDIVENINLSQPTVSHHLKILTEAEIILAEKKGKEVYYSLNQKNISHCCMGFLHHFTQKNKE